MILNFDQYLCFVFYKNNKYILFSLKMIIFFCKYINGEPQIKITKFMKESICPSVNLGLQRTVLNGLKL